MDLELSHATGMNLFALIMILVNAMGIEMLIIKHQKLYFALEHKTIFDDFKHFMTYLDAIAYGVMCLWVIITKVAVF